MRPPRGAYWSRRFPRSRLGRIGRSIPRWTWRSQLTESYGRKLPYGSWARSWPGSGKQKSSCPKTRYYSNYKSVSPIRPVYHPTMNIRIALSLLSLACLSACSTTSQTTTQHQTLEQRLMNKYAATDVNSAEPAPPAEGPEDVPASGPNDVTRNPTLVPSPLLRYWASSRTP